MGYINEQVHSLLAVVRVFNVPWLLCATSPQLGQVSSAVASYVTALQAAGHTDLAFSGALYNRYVLTQQDLCPPFQFKLCCAAHWQAAKLGGAALGCSPHPYEVPVPAPYTRVRSLVPFEPACHGC